MSRKVVTISTTTCGPCIMLKNFMNERHPEGLDGYENVKIDTYERDVIDGGFEGISSGAQDALDYMAEKHIGGIPCTVFFQDGVPVKAVQGMSAINQIATFINEVTTTEGEQLKLDA